mgnify:CR=1 FL=1
MSRQQQFKNREEVILAVAEQLLLESGEGDITLDSLAEQLDLAKGTLYKHFTSKDELFLLLKPSPLPPLIPNNFLSFSCKLLNI